MRIAIDASSAMPPRTGVGNSVHDLVEALAQIDHCNHYTLFMNSLRRPRPEGWPPAPNFRVRRWRLPGPWLHQSWESLEWPPPTWLAGRCDLFHAAASIPPPPSKTPFVLTVNDCYFMHHPEQCHPLGGQYLARVLPERIGQAERVVCISEFTRREVLKTFDIDPSRVRVVPLGVDTQRFRPLTGMDATGGESKRLGLPLDFILCVATLEPRKNLEGLVRVYAELDRIMADAPELVIVGGAGGFRHEKIGEAIRETGMVHRVHFLDFVDEVDLPLVYNLARLFVLPSHYEGFGLPVLEAMACGTPVVTSRAEALLEVGGEAAVTIELDRIAESAHILRDLLVSSSEMARLSQAGLERAARFSWRDSARSLLGVYEGI